MWEVKGWYGLADCFTRKETVLLQGRETKMKSVKKRHHYGKTVGEENDTDTSSIGSNKSDKPELVQVDDIVAILNMEKQLVAEDDENLVFGFAEIIYK